MSETVTAEAEKTIEVPAPVVPDAKPSREDLASGGWTKAELDSAEKRGMISTPEKVEAKPVPKEEVAPEVKPEAKPTHVSSVPDYKFTPEEQAIVDANFGKGNPFRAFYFRAKNERLGRQKAEAEKAALLAENAALKAGKMPPVAQVDEQGNVIDPDNQPLTRKILKELRAQEDREAQEAREAMDSRARVLASAHVEQETYAREFYEDFDVTIPLAKEVMQNLETLITDRNDRADVVDLIYKLQIAAANADKIGPDERSFADIAYKIGKFHPKYGKAQAEPKTTVVLPKDPKASGGLTPEQLERMKANTQRRASSASVLDGGGKRTISAEDVDLATLNEMGASRRMAFAKNHPEQYAKLLRG